MKPETAVKEGRTLAKKQLMRKPLEYILKQNTGDLERGKMWQMYVGEVFLRTLGRCNNPTTTLQLNGNHIEEFTNDDL